MELVSTQTMGLAQCTEVCAINMARKCSSDILENKVIHVLSPTWLLQSWTRLGVLGALCVYLGGSDHWLTHD